MQQVLLVDESPTDSALLGRTFRDSLTVVGDAAAALDAVRRQSFAAILVAQELPGRSGLELLRELREGVGTTPILFLTESGEDAIVATALGAGADGCIVKEPGFERGAARAVDEAVRQRATAVPSPAPVTEVDVLVFEVGEHARAILAADVQEILPAATVLRVAGTPPGVEGLLDLRGRLLPVVDMRAVLGLAPRPLEPTDHFIVVAAGDRPMVLHVDRALHLTRGTRDGAQGGVARLDGGLTLLEDPATLLTPAALAVLEARCGREALR